MPALEYPLWVWATFFGVVLAALFVDLAIANRRSHVPTRRETIGWSAVWVILALSFCVFILVLFGAFKAKEFLTGYLIEMSLSVDNLFIFLLIFSFFKVPKHLLHRVLFWGIFMAMLMRMVMIFAGAAIVERFDWVLYLFGGFLIYTGLTMFGDAKEFEPRESFFVRLTKKIIPITEDFEGERFFTRVDGRTVGTLLLLVLIVINIADLVFAIDSIPAIFGITTDKFIVYTSNIFAILGLRTFFFLLSDMAARFHYLKYGLAFVLTFIGLKMLLPLLGQGLIMFAGDQSGSGLLSIVHRYLGHEFDQTVINISLVIVIGAIVASILLSKIFPSKAEKVTDVP